MARLDRRTFLKGGAAAAVGAGLGMFPRFGRAAGVWGAIPEDLGLPKFRVLDLFFPGGTSQWETFYVSHDGENDGANWRGLGEYVANIEWVPGPHAPSDSEETKPFAAQTPNRPAVSWGPATKPLWRSDIFERSRMVLTSHGHEVHSLSAHLVLTGRDMGRPRAAGLGAPIQRHFQSLASPLSIPYAYAFVSADPPPGRDYFLANTLMNGPHPGSSRPLGVKVGTAIEDLMTRNGVSPEADAVLGALREQYRNLLRFKGQGSAVRAAGFEAYDGAAHYLVHAHELDPLFGGDQLAADPVPAPTNHPELDPLKNPTRRSLELAAKMFAHGARHVTVIDGGFETSALRDSDSGMPYDCHHRTNERDLVEVTSAGVFNALSALASLIATPGQSKLQKALGPAYSIDLDTTLIRIFTEFGRKPNATKDLDADPVASSGREHFSAATWMILIGGPVTKRGIVGSIRTTDGPETAEILDALTPTDVYAATLLAAGVDPFASDNLTSGDDFSPFMLAEGTSTATLRRRLKEQVLGVVPFGFKATL
jgi:hypothetical protein